MSIMHLKQEVRILKKKQKNENKSEFFLRKHNGDKINRKKKQLGVNVVYFEA